jgi:hypothetical protein
MAAAQVSAAELSLLDEGVQGKHLYMLAKLVSFCIKYNHNEYCELNKISHPRCHPNYTCAGLRRPKQIPSVQPRQSLTTVNYDSSERSQRVSHLPPCGPSADGAL